MQLVPSLFNREKRQDKKDQPSKAAFALLFTPPAAAIAAAVAEPVAGFLTERADAALLTEGGFEPAMPTLRTV